MTNLSIKWPMGEPQWIDFQEDFVVFGDVEFIEQWEGAESPLWDSYIKQAYNLQWHRLIADKAGWLLGDMPRLLAPSTATDAASRSGKSLLAIWELIDAEDGFVLPEEVVLSPAVLDAPIYSATLETREREFRIFPSRDSGETILARRDLPVFHFDSDSKLEVFPAHLTVEGRKGEFLIHLFSQGFNRCIWEV